MAKSVSMHAAIKHIIGYVSNMSDLLADTESAALKAEQATNAPDIISNCKIDPRQGMMMLPMHARC